MARPTVARLGIDPGISGALALVSDDEAMDLLFVADLPVAMITGKNHLMLPAIADTIATLVALHGEPVVTIEAVHAAPGQGVSSMFRFGYAAGALTGLCVGMGLVVEAITPQRWQKLVGVAPEPDAARQRAMQLYPSLAQRFERKRDHNRADAVLIARAGVLSRVRF